MILPLRAGRISQALFLWAAFGRRPDATEERKRPAGDIDERTKRFFSRTAIAKSRARSMASVSVLACNARWARLILAESNWKCLWVRLITAVIESPLVDATRSLMYMPSIPMYISWGLVQTAAGLRRYRFCHIVAGVYSP